MRRIAILSLLLLAAALWAPSRSLAQDSTLTVFAAASMKTALDQVDAAYTAQSGRKVVASYAASSTLAKQIEQGAPADVFISADTDWMDYGIGNGSIAGATRINLLGNALVVIAPRQSRLETIDIRSGFDLARLAGGDRIAAGDVGSVPAGKYAKAALQALGAWQAAEPKLAMAESVRAALTLVARGEAALGIVYATDARAEPGVKVIGTFPAESHPAIIYPAAATASAKPQARDYLTFLQSAGARRIFETHGFTILARPAS
jgi:molybdate transport system substrate-binding protein